MAVTYTVLSTAETGLLKTPYTKITPSSEVVPAGQKFPCTIWFCAFDWLICNSGFFYIPPLHIHLMMWAVLYNQVNRLWTFGSRVFASFSTDHWWLKMSLLFFFQFFFIIIFLLFSLLAWQAKAKQVIPASNSRDGTKCLDNNCIFHCDHKWQYNRFILVVLGFDLMFIFVVVVEEDAFICHAWGFFSACQKYKEGTIFLPMFRSLCVFVFTQQHWLLLLPVALEESNDGLLFD